MLLAQPTGTCQTSSRMSHQPDNICAGTQVVALVEIRGPNKSACMHVLRMLTTGAANLRKASVPVRLEAHCHRFLAVKSSALPWLEVNLWRRELHRDLDRVLAETELAERPDKEAGNEFLLKGGIQ